MNVTIQIVVKSATHDTVSPEGLHLGGQIVGVHPAINEKPNLTNRLGFGHISDVPVTDISQLNFLMIPLTDGNGMDAKIIARSTWRVDSTLLTADEMNTVIATSELSATWSRFKQVCKNVSTGAFLTDGDII